MEVAPFKMEVAPFFVDFHHFLSIFTIFYRFSRFTHFCRDLHFVAIYALFPQIFLAKIAFSATSHVFCMYALWYPEKFAPPVCFQALVGCLKPTTDPETLSKDHKGVFWSVRGKIGSTKEFCSIQVKTQWAVCAQRS